VPPSDVVGTENGTRAEVEGKPLCDPDQTVGISIRQGSQQDSVHNAEDRGVGTSSKGERENDNGGKTPVFTYLPKRETNVLQGLSEPPGRALIPMQLFGLFYAAVGPPRCLAGILGTHALTDELVFKQYEMCPYFPIQIVLGTIIREKGENFHESAP
jgi:hypothetical protein